MHNKVLCLAAGGVSITYFDPPDVPRQGCGAETSPWQPLGRSPPWQRRAPSLTRLWRWVKGTLRSRLTVELAPRGPKCRQFRTVPKLARVTTTEQRASVSSRDGTKHWERYGPSSQPRHPPFLVVEEDSGQHLCHERLEDLVKHQNLLNFSCEMQRTCRASWSCPWHTPSSSPCLSQQPPAWRKADEMFIWSEFAGRRRAGRPGKRFKSPAPSFWPAADSSSYVRTLKPGRRSSAAPPPACMREQPCLGGSHHPPLPLYLAVERHC